MDIKAQIQDNILLLTRGAETIRLAWPGVCVVLHGTPFIPEPVGKPDGLAQCFTAGDMHFKVTVECNGFFVRKTAEITTDKELPTPDYVEMDHQKLDDETLRVCGYMQTWAVKGRAGAEEEGGGIMPGCGYPIIGRRFFTAIEHQAAFNKLLAPDEISLVQHPVWQDGRLATAPVVFGWADDASKAFADYIDLMRNPPLQAPLFCFCSFWSDPYKGNFEYDVSTENYTSFINAFSRLGLTPDLYTLDAGWQNRQTIFHAKDTFGGDEGLKALTAEANKHGSGLSLWIAHNGPMGIAPEYLQSLGIKIGGGESAAYCGPNYAVLMQPQLEKLLGDRFTELAGPEFKARHFKIDWDNECATSPDFKEKYPTRDHVREASINVMNRIQMRVRQANPAIVTRYGCGQWASPWWLKYGNHLFLADSGDSEYSSLPAKDQRNSAITHRDLMYYCSLVRDRSQIPLDCFDNHEFPHALRNPFTETPAVWSDLVMHSIMRGSTYLTWMLQPEALEDWQAATMRHAMAFARTYKKHIFVRRGHMVLGNPGHGEIYGFIQPGADSTWCTLRNPLPFPQEIELDYAKLCDYQEATALQFYPTFQQLPHKVAFLPHEVKLLIVRSDANTTETTTPVQLFETANGAIEARYPASLTISESIRPMVCETYQIHALEFGAVSQDGNRLFFKLRSPYRMRNLEINICLNGDLERNATLKMYSSRYQGAMGACYAMPVAELMPNKPGCGERKNPDASPKDGRRFFCVPAPEGGEAFFNIELNGASLDQLDIWASGYEAPSREAAPAQNPIEFPTLLPPQHPLGFPLCCKLEK
ncbi:MAG: hypothetical protein IKP00_06650 [Victivallales bacterium]|nr:hypothetical protein [Victivallales bacterium]